MSQYAPIQLKPYGVVSDTDPFDVGDEAWNSVNNMRFNNFAAEKIGGDQLGVTVTEQPYHLQFNGDHTNPKWFYMADGGIRLTDFSTDTDLDTGGTVSLSKIWSSSLFNDIPVMNNTVETPWVWLGTGNVSALPAFPASTICEVVRPYKAFLIAMNATVTSTVQENRLIWSDASDAGALPASWDITDPTTLAGDAWLTSSPGEIIDGMQLRDLFVIYKTHAIYLLRFVGGQSVMKIDKLNINSGILAKDCVQEFQGMHFILADGDVVVFDGQTIKSIADKRVRSAIFDNIDDDNYRNAYVARYDRLDEMWVCYPTTGQVWANKAAIWNWKDDTWTFRDLSESRHMASGLTLQPALTYTAATFTYDSASAQISYAPLSKNPTTDTLVSATDGQLNIVDETFDLVSTTMTSSLEKLTMDLGNDSVKIVRSITPRITADVGTKVYIRVGSQMNPDDQITWGTEQLYTVGTDRKSDFMVKGRYISIKFRTQDPLTNWKIHGFIFDVAKSGQY